MAPTKSIVSLPLVPTAGESSPTSTLVDVTANCRNGVSELKRIKGYSDQLLLPEAMIYGNDLIKVWSLEDEQQTETSNSFDDTTHQTMIRLQEESTYNKKSYLSLDDFPKDSTPANEVPTMFPVEEIDILEEEEMDMDMDDLLMALPLPPSTITLTPRPSLSPMSPPVSPTLSSLSRDSIQSNSTLSSGSTKTIVLDNIESTDDLLKPTKPPRGHRRSHRRNNSHFDFQFT
jgi:hypothetical protein